MLEKIIIADFNHSMTIACKQAFKDFKIVDIYEGDYFSNKADMMVSPANSFGYMDGGLNLAIRNQLGESIEIRVRQEIQNRYLGEIPIGSAFILGTGHKIWPYLCVAPTMRVSSLIDGTLNVYHSFRAILAAVITYNKSEKEEIKSILCPGLGTGIGGVPETKAARQMAFALSQIKESSIEKSATQRLKENFILESLK